MYGRCRVQTGNACRDSISILSATGLLTFFLLYPFPHRNQKETNSREKYLNKHRRIGAYYFFYCDARQGEFRKCFEMSKYLKVAKPNSAFVSWICQAKVSSSAHWQQRQWKLGARDGFVDTVMTVAAFMYSHLILTSFIAPLQIVVSQFATFMNVHCHKQKQL